MTREEVENIILTMADIVKENRDLRNQNEILKRTINQHEDVIKSYCKDGKSALLGIAISRGIKSEWLTPPINDNALEYIIQVSGISQRRVAEMLGIRPQNITLWIRGKQPITRKHIPALEAMFGISRGYFTKKLTIEDMKEIMLKVKRYDD